MKNKCIFTEEIIREYHYASLLYYFKKHLVTGLVSTILTQGQFRDFGLKIKE